MRLAFLTLLAFGLAACGGETPNRAIVRDSAGVRIVENTDPLWQPGEEWRLSAEPQVDIGGGDTDEDQLFRVVGALRLDDGRIVVANRGSSELRFFDRDGRLLSASGGRGDGPGEFQRLVWLSRAGADTLAGYDDLARRLSLFDARGTFVRSFSLAQWVGGGDADVAGTVTRGRLLRLLGRFAGGAYLASQVAGDIPRDDGFWRREDLLLRYDADGQVADTMGTFPSTEMSMSVTTQGNTRMSFGVPTHFSHTGTFKTYGQRFYAATGDRYEVMVYSSDGALESIIRRIHEPIPVTQQELDQLLEAQLADAEDEDARRRTRESFESRAASSTIPALETIAVDDGGNLWVQEYEWPPGRPPTWTVFDADGRFLGAVAFPERFTPYQIGDDFILGRWQDELDVEHVLLYELIKPER